MLLLPYARPPQTVTAVVRCTDFPTKIAIIIRSTFYSNLWRPRCNIKRKTYGCYVKLRKELKALVLKHLSLDVFLNLSNTVHNLLQTTFSNRECFNSGYSYCQFPQTNYSIRLTYMAKTYIPLYLRYLKWYFIHSSKTTKCKWILSCVDIMRIIKRSATKKLFKI